MTTLPDGIRFGRETCGVLAAAESREWLCTNGRGSYASGTVAGMLTRRYHGLLMAALKPPLGRTLLVARLEEVVFHLGRRHELSTNRWADGAIAPAGHLLVESFVLEGTTPTWTFELDGAQLRKRIFMEQGACTTYVRYELLRASGPLTLEMKVLVSHRPDHGPLDAAGDERAWAIEAQADPAGLRVQAGDGAPVLRIVSDRATPTVSLDWYHGFRLAVEGARGLPDLEDHLLAGSLTAELREGGSLTVACSTEDAPSTDGAAAWARRAQHEEALLQAWRAAGSQGGTLAFVPQLVVAADAFVAERPHEGGPAGTTILAGHPWFGDWGRDAMIALPGLTLVTGRPAVGRSILATFARFVDRGMLPNFFPDAGQSPEYNTADAALWLVEALRAHVAATADVELLRELSSVLDEILRSHVEGSRHGIGVDPADGLLRSGEPGAQLTWMDARVQGRPVTPRTGKCVEINALWYNALCAMASFRRRLGRPDAAIEAHAERVRASFGRFWNAGAGYLFDVIDGPHGGDASMRPNQILAVSLHDSPLGPKRQRDVLDAVMRDLLTPFGLRTLAPGSATYRGRYEGGVEQRDNAYHQGAAWAWLIGPCVQAHLRVHGDREAARRLLEAFASHLLEAGLGSVSELFDGDAPHLPRGCPWQAWSVAEVLRAAALVA